MEYHLEITEKEYEQCKEFANESSKSQRENRSGGTDIRNQIQIFQNTFLGKVGEVIVKKFLEQEIFNIEDIKLDFGIYPRGFWDDHDLKFNQNNINIKSIKHFSNWLLLESKDIERDDISDYYILVSVDANFKGGKIKGFVSKEKIIKADIHTLLLKKDELIPGTNTKLDVANHARHSSHLKNLKEDWLKFEKEINC